VAAVVYCGNCGAPNAPGTAFCGRCGAALARAAGPAIAVAPAPAAAAPAPAYAGGYAYPQYQQVPYRQAAVHKTQWWIWGVAAGGVIFAMIVLGILAVALGPSSNPTRCTAPNCQKVKLAPPLGAPHRYTSKALGYSVDYYDHPGFQNPIKVSAQDDKSIAWEIANWPWVINGDKAAGHNGQQMVEAIQQQKFADAQFLFTLPGVTFGATPGYGNVYRIVLKNNGGQTIEARLVIAAAVKNDLAIELVLIGPYVKSTQADGHPNPSNNPVAPLADEMLKNVYWPGDPEL